MRLIDKPVSSSAQLSNSRGKLLGLMGGSIVALVTPMRGGQLDRTALSRLCKRQIERGTSALLVCGSTGEGSALSVTEQAGVIAAAVEAAETWPVIAECGAAATEAATAFAISAARHGASALLCAPPPYSRPTQEGVMAHIRAVAYASDLPVILYDIPGRTGVAITDETIASLFECGLIVAVKDASGDLSRPVRLRALCGGDLVQFGGDDATAAAHLAMGGHGCISITANVSPALCARMHQAWDAGDLDEFGRVRDQLSPLHQAMFHESNPIPVKAALSLAGLCDAELRLPLTRATQATFEHLARLLPALLTAEEEANGPRLSLVM